MAAVSHTGRASNEASLSLSSLVGLQRSFVTTPPQKHEVTKKTTLAATVRYLRMLSNSLVAALVASAYVLTLVLQLNPALPLGPSRLMPIATTVGLFYALHLTVVFYLVLVLRQLFARELFSPAWVSVGVLTWLGAASAMGGAALVWANLETFDRVLEPSTVRQIINGAITLVVSAAFFVFVALLRAHMGSTGRPIWSVLFVATVCGSIVAPLAARGRAKPPYLEAHPI